LARAWRLVVSEPIVFVSHLRIKAGWEIYGAPSDQGMASMRRLAASSGVPLTVHPELFGGFLRPTAAGGA
jgi:hypothetical protein